LSLFGANEAARPRHFFVQVEDRSRIRKQSCLRAGCHVATRNGSRSGNPENATNSTNASPARTLLKRDRSLRVSAFPQDHRPHFPCRLSSLSLLDSLCRVAERRGNLSSTRTPFGVAMRKASDEPGTYHFTAGT
jgi:hypothetical protein